MESGSFLLFVDFGKIFHMKSFFFTIRIRLDDAAVCKMMDHFDVNCCQKWGGSCSGFNLRSKGIGRSGVESPEKDATETVFNFFLRSNNVYLFLIKDVRTGKVYHLKKTRTDISRGFFKSVRAD